MNAIRTFATPNAEGTLTIYPVFIFLTKIQ